MRKWIGLGFALLFSASAVGQSMNVNLLGRWGQGRSEAIHRRGIYSFVGNGSSIEVYRNKRGVYAKSDELLLPGLVKDIWTRGDLSMVYVACHGAGLQIVQFDKLNGQFLGVVGAYNTNGLASGLMVFGNILYLADGRQGLAIFDVENPYNPVLRGGFPTAGFANDVWAVNDSTVLVAADSAGLYALKTKNPAQPQYLDSLKFSSAFPGFSVPVPRAYRVITVDTVAYVSVGWGGLRTVNFRNPRSLKPLGTWTYGIPVEVMGCWVSGDYAHLSCGKDGLFSPINITNPANPTGPPFQNVNTAGFSNDLVVVSDTAFVADGYNGHMIFDVREGFQAAVLDSILMGDICYDALFANDYVYVGAGKTGVKIFASSVSNPPVERMIQSGAFDTPGEARGMKKSASLLYVADGSFGLTILNASNPVSLVRVGEFPTEGDTCYQVDVVGSYAFLACGRDGLRIVDVSGSIFEVPGSPLNTRGRARDVHVAGGQAFVADSGAVAVFNVSGLPGGAVTAVDLLPSTGLSLDARAIEVSGDTVWVANGRYGILLWRRSTRSVVSFNVGGICTDLAVREKTLFASDAQNGFRIFDASTPREMNEVGYYRSSGQASGITISGPDGKVLMADGPYGFSLLESFIRPQLLVTPATVNFGPVPPDYSRALTVLVANTGTSVLKVTDIRTTSTTFRFSETRFTVAAGDTHRLVVRFEPKPTTWPFLQVATAALYSNDPEFPLFALTLQGEVTAPVTEGPYSVDTFTTGLWHLDEADGTTTVTDASGNGLHGQTNGDPVRQDATRAGFGRVIAFDKTNDWIRIPAGPQLNLWNAPFTVELWFAMASKPQTSTILAKRGNDNTQQFELALGSGDTGIIGKVWNGSGGVHTLTAGSMDNLNLEQWYHVAMVWTTDTLKLFLNGVLKSKAAVAAPLRFQATEPLAIGANAFGGSPFHGWIDEVRVSGIARESWEFHVTRSRLEVTQPMVPFGNVLVDRSRTVPLAITNVGSQSLLIAGLSTNNAHVTVSPSSPFTLYTGQSDTAWVTFSPEGEEFLGPGTVLTIQSNDPTFPTYTVPLRGQSVSTLPAGPYRSDAFTLGLWHLDEPDGSTAIDSSGLGMQGTLSGGVFHELEVTKFENGGSLRFEGQNGIVAVRPPTGVRVAPVWGGFSAEAWVYLRGLPLGKGTLLKRGSTGLAQFHLFVDSTSAFIGQVFSTDQQMVSVSSRSMGNLRTRQWYHAALVLEQDSLRLYVNGNSVDTKPFRGKMAGTSPVTSIDTLSVLIGSNWERSTPLYGYLDEVRISSVTRKEWEFNVNLARFQVIPSKLVFDRVVVGQSRTLTLWVTNNGIDALSVTNLTSSYPSVFTVDTTRFTLQPGQSQRIRAQFRPAFEGRFTGQFTFRTNDPFWPVRTVGVEGTGTTGRLSTAYSVDSFTTALFHFDEPGDTSRTVWDSTGARLKGTLETGVSRTDSGRYGRALRFSGGSLRIPANPVLNFTSGPFTLEFWFSISRMPAPYAVLFKQGNGDTSLVEIGLNTVDNEGVVARIWDSNGSVRTLRSRGMNSLHARQWIHTALEFDGDSLRLFVNNLAKDKSAFSGPFRSVRLAGIRMGTGLSKEQPFHGDLDELRISAFARYGWEFNVVPPTAMVAPTELIFAPVLIGESRDMRFWVQNAGDQDLVVASITGATTQFSVPDTMRSFTLANRMTAMVQVTYRPSAINTLDEATLVLGSNDPDRPTIAVRLEGSGTESRGRSEYTSDPHTIALYHLNDTRTDTVYDASGNLHHGLIKNDAVWVSNGYYGGAVFLDGKRARMEIPPSQDLVFDYASQSFTVECYFRTDTLSQSLLALGFDDTTHSVNYAFSINEQGRLRVSHFNIEAATRTNDAAWHHMALTFNHLTQIGRLYLDGQVAWTKTLSPFTSKQAMRPLVMGAAESDSGLFTGFFQGYLDEVRVSDIVREPWEFQPVETGIAIESLKPEVPVEGEPLTVSLYVPTALQASKVLLHYRAGGQTPFGAVDAVAQTNSIYKAILPGTAVTLQGLEYYVEAKTPAGSLTFPGLDPVRRPSTAAVRSNAIGIPFVFQSRQFQMFSVPAVLDSNTVQDVLEDDLGSYDPYQWRFFRWTLDDTTKTYRYIGYAGKPRSIFQFLPGRAFWMVTQTEKQLDVGRGTTVPLDSSFVLTLHAGWNMIGNPFLFPVRWDNCSVSSDSVVGSLYAYVDDVVKYSHDWETLDPWKGYWIYNASLQPAEVFISPRQQGLAKVELGRLALDRLGKEEWLIRFSAETRQEKDLNNFAGVKTGAGRTWDAWDRMDPPPVAGGLSLRFDNRDWSRHAGAYSVDVRASGESGYVWAMALETGKGGEEVALSWSQHPALPNGWQGFLFDLSDGTSIRLDAMSGTRVKTPAETPGVRRFKLVVGSREFVESQSEGIPLEPVAFGLSQNYPNPFNPVTAIRYGIPKNGNAELAVFNTLGQRVRVLVDGPQTTGFHTLQWDGRSDEGIPLPTGMYIVRLRTDAATASRKMILLK
jgi:hypothetical protein